MNKSARSYPRPLREFLGKVVGDVFTRQGFASAELVTRWSEIVGEDIAACSEPIRVQWPRAVTRNSAGRIVAPPEEGRGAGTLVLRVEGPAALEVQHLAAVICERVNGFLGWRAIDRLALRQAPLRRTRHAPHPAGDTAAAARIAETLSGIADDELRQALARLGAAIKRR